MSWPPVAADLYIHGAPESYFTGVAAGTITAALLAALGECGTALAPRAGGPPEDWTWTSASGQEEATRDVCIVAAAALSYTQGLVLPVQQTVDGDRTYNDRASEVRAKWARMGTSGVRPAAPLYAGLVDATASTTEGAARGWYTAFGSQNDEVEA